MSSSALVIGRGSTVVAVKKFDGVVGRPDGSVIRVFSKEETHTLGCLISEAPGSTDPRFKERAATRPSEALPTGTDVVLLKAVDGMVAGSLGTVISYTRDGAVRVKVRAKVNASHRPGARSIFSKRKQGGLVSFFSAARSVGLSTQAASTN